jgi:hypothetical protein
MPLQFFDDVADKTHDDRLAAGGGIVKSICRQERILFVLHSHLN